MSIIYGVTMCSNFSVHIVVLKYQVGVIHYVELVQFKKIHVNVEVYDFLH